MEKNSSQLHPETAGADVQEFLGNYPRSVFNKLNGLERLNINLVYFRKWRGLVKASNLGRVEKRYFKLYFLEIHSRYYKKVVLGPNFLKVSRLFFNFLFSRVNENLRAVLTSVNPYNLTAFVGAVRAQMELNALTNKVLLDPKYHQEHFLFNEDRSKVQEQKTVININTLMGKLSQDVIPYTEKYNELSLLLHPNPSAVKFYAQAEGMPTEDKNGVFSPRLSRLFEETIVPTAEYDKWFVHNIYFFLTCVEHFLALVDELHHDFFVNETEEKQFEAFAWLHLLEENKKEILKSLNQAKKLGGDPSEALQGTIKNIIDPQSNNEREN